MQMISKLKAQALHTLFPSKRTVGSGSASILYQRRSVLGNVACRFDQWMGAIKEREQGIVGERCTYFGVFVGLQMCHVAVS